MNKFVGWNLIHTENDKCGKCGMKEDPTKKGCCKDEHKHLKLNNDQERSATHSFIQINSSPIILHPLCTYSFQLNKFESASAISFHPPPLFTLQKLNILYCTFQI
jgi:hypothetical protein